MPKEGEVRLRRLPEQGEIGFGEIARGGRDRVWEDCNRRER